jgi:hypothetical protein
VEQLYDQALAAYWTEQWDEAVDSLSQVLSRERDYADAARKLELARHQQELANHYAKASAAADAGDWEQAVAEYSTVADSEPDYRDTNARLGEARRQHQLASLLSEVRRLHRAGQWTAVMKVGEQLQAIDPAAADPDGLITFARAELAAAQQAAKLAADYHTGLRLIDAGRWKEAAEALERVTRLDSSYKNASTLLNRARRELAQAEEQARRQAEEQARRQAEEQARRQAEEQARRQAEEQARRQAEEQARRQAEVQAWQLAEVQARRQAEEQARRQAEEQARAQEKRQKQPPHRPARLQQPPYQPADGTQARPAQRKPSAAVHPRATLVLVFGICAILFGITSILAVVFGRQALRDIDAQPARYSGRARVVVGLILGWVFLCLYGFILLAGAINLIVFIGEG